MKRIPWLSAILNFFLPGLGFLLNGKRIVFSLVLMVFSIGSTYVEMTIKGLDPMLFKISFANFFVFATLLAVEAFKEAKAINESR